LICLPTGVFETAKTTALIAATVATNTIEDMRRVGIAPVDCLVDEACNFDGPVRRGKQIAAAGVRGNVVTLEKCTIRLVVTIRVVLVGKVRDVYCTDDNGQSEDEALRTHFENGWRVVEGLVFCDCVEEQAMRADDRLLEDFEDLYA
jgi:hypothetical protein